MAGGQRGEGGGAGGRTVLDYSLRPGGGLSTRTENVMIGYDLTIRDDGFLCLQYPYSISSDINIRMSPRVYLYCVYVLSPCSLVETLAWLGFDNRVEACSRNHFLFLNIFLGLRDD